MKLSKESAIYRHMLITITIFVLLLVIVWIGGLIYSNDFSVPTKSSLPANVKKVLIVFPHADDEALTSGGFISNLSNKGIEISWVVLTKGEKGNPKGEIDEKLKEVRINETKNAAHIYKITNVIQRDYPDGSLTEHKSELEADLKSIIREYHPDLIITYDLAGLYGHPDHIVTSEVIVEIVKTYPEMKLWYASYPKRILNILTLPDHMAKDKDFRDRRVFPTHKVWVGINGVTNKIKAVYNYKSQRNSYTSSFPFKFIPLWFYISLTPFEYYHEAE